jgi:hypothetical protein
MSYEVAPLALHVRLDVRATPVEPLDGVGDPGTAGGWLDPAVDTATLSRVAVFNTDVSWLITARPTSAFEFIVTVRVATTDHVEPFADTDATIEFPVRTSRSHAGSA